MRAVDDELVLACLMDQAVLDELAHHVSRQRPSLVGFLEFHHLLLQLLELGTHLLNLDVLLGFVLLLLQLGLLVGANLCHGPTALARGLQHVRADSLGH